MRALFKDQTVVYNWTKVTARQIIFMHANVIYKLKKVIFEAWAWWETFAGKFWSGILKNVFWSYVKYNWKFKPCDSHQKRHNLLKSSISSVSCFLQSIGLTWTWRLLVLLLQAGSPPSFLSDIRAALSCQKRVLPSWTRLKGWLTIQVFTWNVCKWGNPACSICDIALPSIDVIASVHLLRARLSQSGV